MTSSDATPSARKAQLLDAAYTYVLEHGLTDMSLRPLAAAIGSSPRVLLYLFGSKDGLVQALLARARADELRLLDQLAVSEGAASGLADAAERLWSWLAAQEHRTLLTLWVEAYARSLVEPHGPWAGYASATVEDWLTVLAATQPPARRGTAAAMADRTLVLAVLRGAMLDLLATADTARITGAVHRHLAALRAGQLPHEVLG